MQDKEHKTDWIEKLGPWVFVSAFVLWLAMCFPDILIWSARF